MNPNPILRALSSIRKSGARTLLPNRRGSAGRPALRVGCGAGGQACVFYGAAEFSRDLDLLILADPDNLQRLQSALTELEAGPVAVPSFEAKHLLRGHAVHFRCRRQNVAGLRIDVMSLLRGAPPFEELWQRRAVIEVAG